MTTGERMKKRRKELGLSAESIATELSVSPATIYRYEKGDIEKMPGEILMPLAHVLKTTPSYLMGWEDMKKEMSEQGVTLDDLAFELAISKPLVEKIINSAEINSPETLKKVIKVAQVLIQSSTKNKKEKPAPGIESELDSMDYQLIELLHTLTPDQKQLLLAQLKTLTDSQR